MKDLLFHYGFPQMSSIELNLLESDDRQLWGEVSVCGACYTDPLKSNSCLYYEVSHLYCSDISSDRGLSNL